MPNSNTMRDGTLRVALSHKGERAQQRAPPLRSKDAYDSRKVRGEGDAAPLSLLLQSFVRTRA
jgi:hypothetical protein